MLPAGLTRSASESMVRADSPWCADLGRCRRNPGERLAVPDPAPFSATVPRCRSWPF
jgi:hypothetical protein